MKNLGEILLVFSVVWWCLFAYALYSYGSDCYLPKDEEHKSISTCTSCHPEHSESAMNRCGANCFECHSYHKVMQTSPAHEVIKHCVKCHTTIKKKNNPINILEEKENGCSVEELLREER